MRIHLRKVILWPRHGDREPRTVEFQSAKVNVISGFSKTGKSAIIPIVDYCLGSEKCAIPVNTIRQACSWFGVLLDTSHGELLLARREPGDQKATGDMYVAQGTTLRVPHTVQQNSTVDQAKQLLDDLAGLTRLDFDPAGSGVPSRARPSFRDMVSFVFQPQNIVANPNVMFYKADISEHREKLRTIFPFVLGAVTPDVLAAAHELQRLRGDLRKKERELASISDVSSRWLAEIRSRISRAFELGLLRDVPPDGASMSELIGALKLAADTYDPEKTALSPGALESVAHELVELQSEEAAASNSLSELRQRFSEMARFREAATSYQGSLGIRRDRLKLAEWIGAQFGDAHECPFCRSQNTPIGDAITELQAALEGVEKQAGDLSQVPAAFDREFQRVRSDLDRATERINALRIRRRALSATSDAARRYQYMSTEAARFIGSLDEAIERYEALAADSALTVEIDELKDRIAGLEAILRQMDPRGATERATRRFTSLAAQVLPDLDAERPQDPVELAIDDLTVKVIGPTRDDYLWEIGSGANWLSYHIATTISLHEMFLGLRNSPVPSFVVYDQPSQVYFPHSANAGTEAQEGESTQVVRDEDVAAVRRVFNSLAMAVRRSRGMWQAIVLDHADAAVWGGLDDVQLVEEWRHGNTLVPMDWL